MNKKLWAGRFSKSTHPEVESYTASITFDCALIHEDILGSLAHTAMLEHCQLLTPLEAKQIQDGLKQIAEMASQEEMPFHISDEDIHMNIERLLHEKIGNVAGKLHTARSRNDQVALDLHLYLRKQIIIIVELLQQVQKTLMDLALEHKNMIIPGYTHLQRAQPIYLAQHWQAYIEMLQRDCDRLGDLWVRVNQSPLGACALTGTTFATDKKYTADLLKFADIYHSTLDAVSDRDFVIEFLAASALIMMHFSRLSEELILWSSQEFNFISIDDAFSTGSSIMPQKKNPDVAELARGKTGRVYGALFSLLTILKGLPLAYNKDLQEDKEPLFDVVKTLRETLSVYAPMLATITINKKVLAHAVHEGYLNATALAEYLVKKGLAFRVAHEVVGKMVAHCVANQLKLTDLSVVEMQTFNAHIQEDVYGYLKVDAAVALCNRGTTFDAINQKIATTSKWLEDKNKLLSEVYHAFGIHYR